MTNMEMRQEMAQLLLTHTRNVLDGSPLNRDTLEQIKLGVMKLSDRNELWIGDEFPEPNIEEKQNRFLIAQDKETGHTLYLNVMRPGKKIPPHDHTTWACVSAVEGSEINTLFDRIDDGSVPGKAELCQTAIVDLKPGTAVALLPDDIHSVEIQGEKPIRHLHFYGRPLETLTGRTCYDLDAGTCKIMDIGVKTKS